MFVSLCRASGQRLPLGLSFSGGSLLFSALLLPCLKLSHALGFEPLKLLVL
jgi:hypothetical protein